MPTQKNAFEGLELKSALGGGKQKKARYTGFYANSADKSKMSVLKKSEDYPADNVAEVVTSSLLVNTIGSKNAIAYTFKKSSDDGLYLESEVRRGFKDLEQTLHANLKKKKGFFPALPRWGWLASNPTTLRNKKNIQKCFNTPVLKKDMANVLAGCLLVLDVDCQVKNICFYTDVQNNRRIAKFDDGWGLADICKPENAKVDLFGSLKFYGDRATHKASGLPTNHFIDYPYILHSADFAASLKEIANQKDKLLIKVNTALEEIEKGYANDPKGLKQAYKDFALHLGIELKSDDTNTIKETIKTRLSESLENRAESMLILSYVLKIKLKIDNGEMVTVDKDCQELIEILKKYSDPASALPNFDNVKEPFIQTSEAKEKLERILQSTVVLSQLKARKQSQEVPDLQRKSTLLNQYNPSARHKVLVNDHSNIPTLKEFLKTKTATLPDTYQIQSFHTFSSGATENLELHFKNNGNTHRTYIQPALASAQKGGLTYSIDNQIPSNEQDTIIINICKFAVDAVLNTPNPEFDLTHTAENKVEGTKNALIAAIQENKEKGLYTVDNPEPIIKQGNTILYGPSLGAHTLKP